MRKISLILISILYFGIEPVNAQLYDHPHFISLNIGTNVPVSEYKTLDTTSIGSAKLGYYYSFEAGAYFSKVLGIGLNLGVFNNPVNEDDLEEQFKERANSIENFDITSDDWVNGFIMLGPILSLGKNNFIVDLKLLGGIMNTSKPFISLFSQSGNNELSFSSSEVNANTFGVNYGMHLRIRLVNKLWLRINAEGFQASQEFKTKIQETDFSGNSSEIFSTAKKEISALNLGAGLAITF